jgi:hypothetical protein
LHFICIRNKCMPKIFKRHMFTFYINKQYIHAYNCKFNCHHLFMKLYFIFIDIYKFYEVRGFILLFPWWMQCIFIMSLIPLPFLIPPHPPFFCLLLPHP